MKPQTLTVFIAFAALTATAGWVMNPISWTYDEDSRTLTTDGTSSFALACAAESGGAGLGLAIARRIARLHGGDVVLSPAVPSGARFVLSVRGGRSGQDGR